jgi:hypothetical protein
MEIIIWLGATVLGLFALLIVVTFVLGVMKGIERRNQSRR